MKPLVNGISIGILTIAIYLLIVVITTPALAPYYSIRAAFLSNWSIISGIAVGVGLQTFLSSYSRMMGCSLDMGRKSIVRNSGSASASSFFSFFSLIPLGCCSWWLYAISFFPSIFGTAVSGILLNYSHELAYGGLIIIFVFDGLTAFKLRKQLKSRKIV